MKLGGQGELRLRERFGGQGGYAMATLLVAMGLMAIFMSAALPAWSQMAQREKEEEYLFRANQYALAVARCRIKQCGANGFAPSVDFLIEQKYLRKKYKDPLTGKDFVPVFQNQAIPGQAQQAGQAGSTFGATGPSGQPGRPSQGQGQQQSSQQSSLATAKSLATDKLRITESEGGTDGARPLTGVTSSSKATGLRLFKGQETTYDQWAVTADDVNLHLGGRSVGTRFAATQVAQGAAQQGQGQQRGQGQQQQSPVFGGPGGGFGTPNPQGQPVFPQQPFGGGQPPGGQAPPSGAPPSGASPFGSRRPPL